MVVVRAPLVLNGDEFFGLRTGIGLGHELLPLLAAARTSAMTCRRILRDLRIGGSEVSRGLRRLLDSAGEHRADATIFQHQQACNGATGGSGDVVTESRGMPA